MYLVKEQYPYILGCGAVNFHNFHVENLRKSPKKVLQFSFDCDIIFP